MLKWLIVDLLSVLAKFSTSAKTTGCQVPSLDSGNQDWVPVTGDVLIFLEWPLTKCVEGRGLSVLGANAQLKYFGDRKLWFVTFKVETCNAYLVLL